MVNLRKRFFHAIQRATFVADMEEEAIILAVEPGPRRVIGESLNLEFLHVRFRVLATSKYQSQNKKATLKSPRWLSELQTSAPIDGYSMENGEFIASLPKDDRIKADLKVTLEVIDL